MVKGAENYYFYYGPDQSLVRFERDTLRYFLKFLGDTKETLKPHDNNLVAKTQWYGMEITQEEYDTSKIKPAEPNT